MSDMNDAFDPLSKLPIDQKFPFTPIRLAASHDPSLCIGLPSPGNNTPLGLVSCNDRAADMFIHRDYLFFALNGDYHVPSQCIDVPSGYAFSGQRLQSYECGFAWPAGNRNQYWQRNGDFGEGNDKLLIGWTPDVASGMSSWCLAVGGWYYSGEHQTVYDGNYKVGEPVVLRPCSPDDHNQRWNIVSR